VDAAPVITRGHNVAALIPPVTEAALPYLLTIPDRRTLVLTPDAPRAVALAEALVAAGRDAAGIVAVSGLARAARRLAPGMPAFVLAAADDAAALLRRSALKPAEAQTLVLAWPEELDEEAAAALEAVLSECDKEAQRLLFASIPGPAVDALLERYAWKAMTFGFPAVDEFAPTPIGPARFVVGPAAQFDDARRRVLDALNLDVEDTLVIAPCPASREAAAALAALAARAGADGSPVFVVQPCQLPWLRRHFRPLTALRLPSSADLAERRAERIRATLAGLIESGDLDKDLCALNPLFDRYDPADVAAAAVRAAATGLLGQPGAEPAAAAPAGAGVPTWAKLWVGVGKKDGIRPGDLVGAIIGETKIAADRVGKIDIRELYAIVEIRGEDAERVAAALTGATMRGRRLTARIDRGHGPGGARGAQHRP